MTRLIYKNFITLIFTALALFLLSLPIKGQAADIKDVTPTFEELPFIAASLVKGSPEISQIWTDFWSAEEAFILLSPKSGIFLFSKFLPPTEYHMLPEQFIAFCSTGWKLKIGKKQQLKEQDRTSCFFKR